MISEYKQINRYRNNENPGGDNMSHYTYIVTNKINGKVYVGSHSWDGEGLDKNYYGSGTAITRAVKKYGKENFQIEVLYFYDTVEECRADEERILTEYNVRDCPHSYNIKNASIGFTSEDVKGENNPQYGKRGKDAPMYGRTGEKHPMYGRTGEKHPMYGRTHTENTRNKISQAHGGKPFVAIKDGKIKIFTSQHECSRVLGLHPGSVNKCLKGKYKTTGGYSFKYIEELESGIYEGMTGIAE